LCIEDLHTSSVARTAPVNPYSTDMDSIGRLCYLIEKMERKTRSHVSGLSRIKAYKRLSCTAGHYSVKWWMNTNSYF
ncbi:MAG: hypothetical protein WCF23_03885, partial [Candidatus Nitrosopolaris sp.]